MDIPQVTTVELHGAGGLSSGHRRRPPKLKSNDRSVSMVVDNYTPLTSAALSAKNAGPLVINMDEPPPPIAPRRSSPNISEDIFKAHSQSSNSMDSAVCMTNSVDNDYPPVLRKSSSFRRGETIDMNDLPSTSSTSLTHLRKTPSFHSNPGDDGVQIVPLARYHSVRHHPTKPEVVYPSTFQPQSVQYHPHPHQQQQQVASSSGNNTNRNNRRDCNMHRSFHVPSQKRGQARRDAVKSNSFNSDEKQQQQQLLYQQQQQQQQQLSSMQFQQPQQLSGKKHSSIEGELYRSRSNSRNNFDEQLQYLDVWKPAPMTNTSTGVPAYVAKSPNMNGSRPISSNSLDQVLSQGSVSPRPMANTGATAKMLRHQNTIAALNPQFLAPIPLLALDKSFENAYQMKSPVFDIKKSYSLKYKNGPGGAKENRDLFKSRKSKSFISDMEPLDVPFGMSPAVSPGLSASGSIKKHHSPMISPLPQTRANMMLDDMKRRSGEGADLLPNSANLNMEFGMPDFNTIYKSYRQQKSTTGSSRRHKHRRKKSSASAQKAEEDFDSASITKRKRIVCLVMTVFLSLVVFSVLAVVLTLTHSQVAQVQNQTRHVYTFARDSRPIHYAGSSGGGN
ncbi:unnamed protein product [Diamesa hyperborea]